MKSLDTLAGELCRVEVAYFRAERDTNRYRKKSEDAEKRKEALGREANEIRAEMRKVLAEEPEAIERAGPMA